MLFNGGIVTAEDIDSLDLRRAKPAFQVVNNSTTLVNDVDLRMPVSANTIYSLSGLIMFTSGTVPDIKMTFAVPSGTDWYVVAQTWDNTAGAGVKGVRQDMATTGGTFAIPGNGVTFATQSQWMELSGSVTVGSTAGELIMQWAQNTANASNTTVHTGSWLRLTSLS